MAFGEVVTSLSKVKANSLNLAGTYGFSGTVSGLADETPLVLISTFTSDGSDATASFTSGINSTYKEYLFVLNDIHPQTDGAVFEFQASTNTGSSYGVTATTTCFDAVGDEANENQGLGYRTASDLAQSTSFINLNRNSGGDNDQASSGVIRLYNPSSTTFVKHFTSRVIGNWAANGSFDTFTAGYFNTTSAVDAVQFKFASGEIQGGTIDLFGVV